MKPESDARRRVRADAPDQALLRAFEPVVRYTRGERFFPADVHGYIERCELRAHLPDGTLLTLVPEGEVDEAGLVAPRLLPADSVLFLQLVGSLNLAESAKVLLAPPRPAVDWVGAFRAGSGRLARVGYASRLLDGLFSVTLFLRGRVPGVIAKAAAVAYGEVNTGSGPFVYYGRVMREGGWIALQYWYFYYYNSWRSQFHGVNDHESDWETVLVYLYEDEQGFAVPRWLACSRHDLQGDDLRRRWDDESEVEISAGHPVLYAGAGSHASYYRPGEYQTDVSLPLPERLARARKAWTSFWTETLGQARTQGRSAGPLRIPFIDYARGDGLGVGPGETHSWAPVVLDPVPAWVTRYRGLWGLYARDPISGENAPAGPMYNRDGTVRSAWYNPLGFSGMDKVAPPPLARRRLEEQRALLRARILEIDAEASAKLSRLQDLGIQVAAMHGQPHLGRRRAAIEEEIASRSAEAKLLRRDQAESAVLLESLDLLAAQLDAGEEEDERAHIQHVVLPTSEAEMRSSRLAEIWAAASVGLLVALVAVLAAAAPGRLLAGLPVIALIFVLVEALFRGTLQRTVNAISVILAVIALVIVGVRFWWQAVVAAMILVGAVLLWENLRELRG